MNFDQILRIINDVLQGSAEGIGFALGGTPDFLLDTRRGLYADGAIQSRLAENTFAKGGFADYSGPVIRLQNLTPDELLVLFERLRALFAGGDPAKFLVPDEALVCPGHGIYVARADGACTAVSIGVRPTFGTGRAVLVEAYLIDRNEDLYGCTLVLDFLERLRGERRFASKQQLIEQMRTDVQKAREICG